MKPLFGTICLTLALGIGASPSGPDVRIEVDREAGTADVRTRNASLAMIVAAAELRSGVFVEGAIPQMSVSMTLLDVPLDDLVAAVLREAGLTSSRSGSKIVLGAAEEPTVSLDVVDADAKAIIRSLAGQCGIRNVMIDPDVDTSGTFLFRGVPCSTAFRVVLSTLNLDSEMMTSSVLVAGVRE